MNRRPSNTHRPRVSRPGASGLRFGMFAVCVVRDSDPGLNAGKGKPLYDLLVSYADVSSRDTEHGYPYREAMAASLDCSKQTVDRATDYLETEVGLVTVHRRKVEGKPDENDANLYEIHDSWLIHGITPPMGTPPQLVARYGATIPGLDVDAWITQHAPAFDLAAWTARHEEKVAAQQAKREEARRKERARRRKARKGGDSTGDVTPEGEAPEGAASEGGGVTDDASCGVTDDATGRVVDDALSTTTCREPSSTAQSVADAVGKGAGGFASAGEREGAGEESGEGEGGCAASEPSTLPAQRTTSRRPATVKTRPRQEVPGFETVRAAIPAAVAAPGTRLFAGLHRAINDLLSGGPGIPRRTPEQVVARINRRWYGEHADVRAAADYRGCDRCTASGCDAPLRSEQEPEGCDRIKNRNSWLAAAILAQDCPDPSCEDGQLIDSGSCRNCQARREEARAAAEAAAETLARWEADREAAGAADASLRLWEERRAAEETTIRERLSWSGAWGAKLDHQVSQHMAGWLDRNPAPAAPAARGGAR
ncbi:hypothetical protein ACFT0G_25320 [Streptomyces sp. NPDC057020]|uniref:hypothetical protein n=1 Tax=unclassified Streptomyces TaxID=2593676 RepID=UPI00363917D3